MSLAVTSALERQDLSRSYLAHLELEIECITTIIIIIIINIISIVVIMTSA